jgi:hypothetical protein
MSVEDSRVHAKMMLEAAGYSVTPIPRSKVHGQERADLKATLGQEILIVEAKGKAPHQGYFDLLEKVRTQGYGCCSREEVAWNALSSVAEKASCQLEKTPAPETCVRILWISCLHNDWRFVFDAFRHRLYGDVKLCLFRKAKGLPEIVGTRPCFYYNPSDFCRYQSIDAAILAGPNGAQVLVNEFGTRVRQLRNTKLYTEMKELGALLDPEMLRESGKALAILDLSLRDQKAKWQYLFESFGFMTTVLRSYSYMSLTSGQIDPNG